MLKRIPPILSPELLYLIARMGHGDELVIADANFPAVANAKRLVRADGHGVHGDPGGDPPALSARFVRHQPGRGHAASR